MDTIRTDTKWRYCVIGNIVLDRIDESGEIRHGCKEFAMGRKVYLCGKYWDFENETIEVAGLDRHHKYRVVSIPRGFIENVRFSRVYKATVLEIMDNFEFTESWWGNSAEDAVRAKAFVEKWNRLFTLTA